MNVLDKRRWIPAILAACVLVLDVLLAAQWTAPLALLGMAATVLEPVRHSANMARGQRGLAQLRAVVRLEVFLVLILLGFVAARVFVFVGQIQTEGEQLAAYQTAARTYDVIYLVLSSVAWSAVFAPGVATRLLLIVAERPALALVGSFAALIDVGALLLTLPISVSKVGNVSFVDALFTAASAVCVTGLTVNDIAQTYTLFGQLVILACIQLGGIGIMTLAALALTMGSNTSLRSQVHYAAALDASTPADLRRLVRAIVIGTFVIELIGATVLAFLFADGAPWPDSHAMWLGTFHAVSAFCNAGFALFSGNMVGMVQDANVQLVIMVLVFTGGLGFPVVLELVQWLGQRTLRVFRRRGTYPRLSLGSRVALSMSVLLVFLGTVAVWVLEYGNTLETLSFGDGLVAAAFASVNTRTSGFNTLDLAAMHEATLLLMCVLMFIGGSPASTAGGIKTTTVAVFLAAFRGELMRREPQLDGRSIPPEIVRRATAVALTGIAVVFTVLFCLTLSERQPFLALMFEAISAFATVGLSLGITSQLTVTGKLVITAAMFLGRVGPLTVALAVGRDAARQRFRYAREDLPVG